jgi:uncharacterized protein (TIGR02246 family)
MSDLSRREAALAALGAAALVFPAMAGSAEAAPQGSLEALKALLEAHNKAFTAQNMNGVLATMAPNCVLMGTGPGELWTGHKEIANAYQHFFKTFDPGKQSFENLWHDGAVGPMGSWLMAISKVTLVKGDKKTEFGLNLSMACERLSGKWLIRAMHFSNLTGPHKA